MIIKLCDTYYGNTDFAQCDYKLHVKICITINDIYTLKTFSGNVQHQQRESRSLRVVLNNLQNIDEQFNCLVFI